MQEKITHHDKRWMFIINYNNLDNWVLQGDTKKIMEDVLGIEEEDLGYSQ
jgi:hypothetical protein